MDGMALLGILALLYSVIVIIIIYKKPAKIWNMRKIKMFERVLGEKGTVIFFYIFAILAGILGIWLISK